MGKISLVKIEQEQIALNVFDVTNSGKSSNLIIITPIIVLSLSVIAVIFPLNKRRTS
jgi:hypothetical protein